MGKQNPQKTLHHNRQQQIRLILSSIYRNIIIFKIICIVFILSMSLYNCSPTLGEYYNNHSRVGIKIKRDSTFVIFMRLNLAQSINEHGVWEKINRRTYVFTTLLKNDSKISPPKKDTFFLTYRGHLKNTTKTGTFETTVLTYYPGVLYLHLPEFERIDTIKDIKQYRF